MSVATLQRSYPALPSPSTPAIGGDNPGTRTDTDQVPQQGNNNEKGERDDFKRVYSKPEADLNKGGLLLDGMIPNADVRATLFRTYARWSFEEIKDKEQRKVAQSGS